MGGVNTMYVYVLRVCFNVTVYSGEKLEKREYTYLSVPDSIAEQISDGWLDVDDEDIEIKVLEEKVFDETEE